MGYTFTHIVLSLKDCFDYLAQEVRQLWNHRVELHKGHQASNGDYIKSTDELERLMIISLSSLLIVKHTNNSQLHVLSLMSLNLICFLIPKDTIQKAIIPQCRNSKTMKP